MKKFYKILLRIGFDFSEVNRLFIPLILSSIQCVAQKPIPVIDSLVNELKQSKSDTVRSLIMAELSYKYYTIPDSHFVIAHRGLKLATELSFEKGIGANDYSLGAYYSNMGDFETSLKYLNEALTIEKKYNDQIHLGRIHHTLGIVLSSRGDYEEGLQSLKKALNYFAKAKDTEGLLWTFNNIGYCYFIAKEYDSSRIYLLRGEKIGLQTKHNFITSAIYGSLAELYSELDDYNKSRNYLIKAINLNGDVDLIIQSDNYIQLARQYQKIGDNKLALIAGEKAKELAISSNNLNRLVSAYKLLSTLQEDVHNYEMALQHLRNAVVIHDSLFSINKTKSANEARLISKAQLKILEQENDLRRTRLDMQEEEIIIKNLLLISAVALFSLTLIIVLLLTRQSRARNKYIQIVENKNDEIIKQASQLQTLNKELVSLNENLENRAREKAEIILEQEKKIAAYTFINSHKLRAPVATILGIVNLIKSKHVSETEMFDLIEAIDKETTRIDSVVKEITKAIE